MTDASSSAYYKRHPLAMTIHPLDPSHAVQICEWKYEQPFDVYQWPSWQRMKKEGIEFGDSTLREEQYAAILDSEFELIGFAQFFPITGVTRLGLGLRPDLCGQGLGHTFIEFIVREAQQRSPQNEIDLEVLTWNTRAIRAYEQVGFRITDTYPRSTPTGLSECHCMVFEPVTDN